MTLTKPQQRAVHLRRTIVRAAALALCFVLYGAGVEAQSPQPAMSASPSEADVRAARLRALIDEPQGQELLGLLATPEVRAKILAPDRPSSARAPSSAGALLGDSLGILRGRLLGLGETIGKIGRDAQAVFVQLAGAGSRGLRITSFYIVLFLIFGIGCEWVFFRLTAEWRHHVGRASLQRVRERASIAAQRLCYAVLLLVCFTIGSAGPYLLFRWPPVLGAVVLDYLIALVLVRLWLVGLRFILAPGAQRVRLVPMPTSDARFWYRSTTIGAVLAAFGAQTISALGSFGAGASELDSLKLLLALGLSAYGIGLVWTARLRGHLHAGRRLQAAVVTALVTFGLPLVWLTFATGLEGIGWLLIVGGSLPLAIHVARHASASVVRGQDPPPRERRVAVVVERAAQTVVLIIAAGALAHAWQLDIAAFGGDESAGSRVARGSLEALMILLLADLAWHVIKVSIDHRLEFSDGSATIDESEAQRQARLRTLLPVLRTTLWITLLALAALSALSAIGFQIGPFLAGAGIVGIALGLGAQALVRDIISGVFFLFDDAFRVGEYVETGPISGTVEVFSLRSVKLRHYKGHLHTVPFGDIKTMTNYSRTWIAAELEIFVGYDTDIGAVEQAIVDVAQALSGDPLIADAIIEPLVSQGIAAMSETSIRIVMSVKVKAGQQFLARRLIYTRLKSVFDERGIAFATPRLHIEGPNGEARHDDAGPPDFAAIASRRHLTTPSSMR